MTFRDQPVPHFIILLAVLVTTSAESRANEPPNVLFISVDDLNDWIGCLGGHPQAMTPNIRSPRGQRRAVHERPLPGARLQSVAHRHHDRHLAAHARGSTTTARRCARCCRMPSCCRSTSPSTATGRPAPERSCTTSSMPNRGTSISRPRRRKILSRAPSTRSKRPVSLPRGGPWQYVETDWGGARCDRRGIRRRLAGVEVDRRAALSASTTSRSSWPAASIVRTSRGSFRRSTSTSFRSRTFSFPPGYKEDDLDDLPPAGQKRGPNRYFPHIREHGPVEARDSRLPRLDRLRRRHGGPRLDALRRRPNRDNTIVVLWSDHGWHLGEKQHWQKFTAWRVCTRVPLIVRVPAGTPGLPQGTKAGSTCGQPVNLLSLLRR